MVNNLSSYALLYIIASILAILLQLYLSTSVVAKGVASYKTSKPFRVSFQSVMLGMLFLFLFWFAGNSVIPLAIHFTPYYKVLAVGAILFALHAEFHYAVSLWKYGVKLYKTVRGIRILLFFMLIGILGFLFYLKTGHKFFYFMLLLTPEFIHLTVVAIIAFFILYYVQANNEYENLNVFGSVLLITWISIFVIGASVHLALHFKLFEKAYNLFQYLHHVLPGGYKSLPYIILASWIINFFALLYVTVRRITNILIDHVENKIRSSYQEKIIELIYDDSIDNGSALIEPAYFKKVNRLFFTRQLFSDELLRMHEIVYGSLLDRINLIFNSLLLKKDAFNYLHSRHWFYKIKGMRIYAELGDKSEIRYIQKLIESKNIVLRFEAQLALARLSDEDKPLLYLKDLQERLSVWEQLNLIYYYTNHQKPVGDLSGLLESANTSVICFGLLCIRKFNKVDYLSQITELTRHPDWNVQNAAFRALCVYDAAEIGPYIVSRYHHTGSESTQIIMIRSLGQTGDPAVIPFLKEQLFTVTNDVLCIELFRALILIDAKQASGLAQSDYPRYGRLYVHVTETLL
ncbi:MAG: HEAT repeat domain-containing protein [Paludibacter sp.]|nr:HEAT repeat domain-containing protein [Paludibacter sp.]